MRKSLHEYIDFFNKTLSLSNICWWVIDYEKTPGEYYCNELMKDIFSLDKNKQWHSIQKQNHEIMELLISAIQKLVIKDVVIYADNKILISKEVVNGK